MLISFSATEELFILSIHTDNLKSQCIIRRYSCFYDVISPVEMEILINLQTDICGNY